MNNILARSAKVLIFTKEEFVARVKAFYKSTLDERLDFNLDNGFDTIPIFILQRGFNNLENGDLIEAGKVYVSYLLDTYGYQFLSVIIIFEDGSTYFYNPKLNKDDACKFTNKVAEEISPDPAS